MSENQTDQNSEKVSIKLSLDYELEIKTTPEGKEEIFVSFGSTPENDLAAMAIANFHLRATKDHAVSELKKATDFNDKKNAQNAIQITDRAITGVTMLYSMMQNSYLEYRKTVQLSAELAKIKNQTEKNAKESESTGTDTTPSDIPTEQ
jgi:hypothetical protein